MAISLSGLPPIPPYSPNDQTTTEDVDKAIQSLAVTLISDHSLERLEEIWKEEHKHERP